jgi:hypothetical protein
MNVRNLGALDARNWSDGSSRVWGASWRDAEARDPRLPTAQWCVDLRLGSAVVRIATGTVRLRDVTGASRIYTTGLFEDLEIEESYEPGSSPGARSFPLAIPNRMVDALAQIQAGNMLAGEAEVFLAIDGSAYEDRLVVMDGDVTGGVSFGVLESSVVRTSVSDPRNTAALPITPFLIDANRFTAAATSTIGQRYPLVFGDADGVAAALVSYNAATGAARALVCVPTNGAVVSAVYVNGEEKLAADVEFAWESAIMLDALGGQYLGVQFTGVGTWAWAGDESVTVDVTGAADQYLHQCVRGLLEGFTTLGRRRINYDLIGEIVARLGAVKTRLYVNGSGAGTATTAIGAIEGRLLESFPMLSMVTTDGRYGPVVTDARAATRANLVRGVELIDRAAEIEESDKDDLKNGFTILYAYNADTDAYDGVATRTPETSILLSRSSEAIGVRYADPIEAPEIEDDDVAGYVIDWLVYHTSMPSYYVEYSLPLATLLRLRLGWNIALTDDQLGLEGVTAVIVKRVLGRPLARIGFRIYWPSLAGVGAGGGSAGAVGGGGAQGL